MIILNLTRHKATSDQILDGVVDLDDQSEVSKLLTFVDLPGEVALRNRAKAIADLAVKSGVRFAMIGGAPYLMSHLEHALLDRDIVPMYSFSCRECLEIDNKDGSVSKMTVFRHKGFVKPFPVELN